MSEIVQTARSLSKLKKWGLAVTAIAALFALAIIVHEKVIFENLDRSIARFDRQRTERFARHYPTYNEINEYLSDATILISHPPSNTVYYFDKRSNYMRWHGNEISFGIWSSSPYVKIMTFETKWRIAVVNSYCHWLLDEPAYAQQDNCFIIESLDWMFRYLGSDPEYRRGNVFKLSRGSPPPFSLPTTKISIDGLLAAKAD